mmetsp:Transcript_152357/g.265562  ORF Transcript_152357/g.265562 Transcript_152357/m.265562 type:complete len:239 (+) Transcript_152357:46-762(+)
MDNFTLEALSGLDSVRELSALSTGKLGRLCWAQGIDASRYFEKAELVAALVQKLGHTEDVSDAAFAENFARKSAHAPLVFLDVDGVLNNRKTFPRVRLDDPSCLQLARLLERANACIVLSSTWRHKPSLRLELAQALWRNGVKKAAIVGATPDVSLGRRDEEICSWLDANNCKNLQYVVLDDLPLPENAIDNGGDLVSDHGVWIDPDIGLQDTDVEAALQHLLSDGSQIELMGCSVHL